MLFHLKYDLRLYSAKLQRSINTIMKRSPPKIVDFSEYVSILYVTAKHAIRLTAHRINFMIPDPYLFLNQIHFQQNCRDGLAYLFW